MTDLPPNPESTGRYDRYVDDKFLAIFDREDHNGDLANVITEGLAQNDSGPTTTKPVGWFAQMVARAEARRKARDE